MTVLNIALSDQDSALIEQLVTSGQFRSADAVLREGLRLVEAGHWEDSQREARMQAAIRAGVEDIAAGRFTRLNNEKEITAFLCNPSNTTQEPR